MPQVKANQFINAPRSIMVPLVFENELGERLTEPFKVVYRSFSPKVAREMQALESGENVEHTIAESLAAVLVSIPDIVNGDGQPIPINQETLESMDQANLKAIYKAIAVDVNPTQAPTDQEDSRASPASSPPPASKV